jgi:hypothetical protein
MAGLGKREGGVLCADGHGLELAESMPRIDSITLSPGSVTSRPLANSQGHERLGASGARASFVVFNKR